ncbi:MAG: hypothetical protein E7199_01155 [Schwartzia succinivorans]|nr:hypothetical protein [Schwartzia succinivorans]
MPIDRRFLCPIPAISADTSLRLEKYFGVSERYFLNLQNDIDVRNAKKSLHQELDSIRQLIA